MVIMAKRRRTAAAPVEPRALALVASSDPKSEVRALASTLLQRYQFARQNGITFGGLRDLYEIFGYNRELSATDYRDRYARGGIAKRIVDVYPNATWRGVMEIIEDENPEVSTAFEQAWLDFEERLRVSAVFNRVDKLSRLSSFAVILIGAPGLLGDELPRGSGTTEPIAFLRPVLGGGGTNKNMVTIHDASATIREFDQDPASSRFGLPKFYQVRIDDNVARPESLIPIHWTRIIHVAPDGFLENELYGPPALEDVWNLLDDLDKITGGGAEAFFLRANQGLHLDIAKDMQLANAQEEKESLKAQAEEYKHQMTRWLRTRGVNVNTLGSDVANFANPADAVITQIAGTKGIPKRILTGSEMGELASSQDRENWRDQVVGRQKGHAEPVIVRQLVDRLITYGYLPTPKGGPRKYQVTWDGIQTLTEQERMEGASSWADTTTSEGQVFTNAEIRDKWYGLEPLSPEEQAKLKPAPPALPPGATGGDRRSPAENVDDEFPRAAEEMIRVLEAAIAANNTTVIDRILGLERS